MPPVVPLPGMKIITQSGTSKILPKPQLSASPSGGVVTSGGPVVMVNTGQQPPAGPPGPHGPAHMVPAPGPGVVVPNPAISRGVASYTSQCPSIGLLLLGAKRSVVLIKHKKVFN